MIASTGRPFLQRKKMATANDHGLKSPTYKLSNESVLVKSGYGRLRGILVTAAKLATLELLDNTSNAIPVLAREFSVDAPKYYHFADVAFENGLYIVAGGTIYFSVFYF